MIETPAVELLGHMDMAMTDQETEAERERARFYMHYLIQEYAQRPVMGKESPARVMQRKQFIESIKPKTMQPERPQPQRLEGKGSATVYDWDTEMLKRIKERQQRKAPEKINR